MRHAALRLPPCSQFEVTRSERCHSSSSRHHWQVCCAGWPGPTRTSCGPNHVSQPGHRKRARGAQGRLAAVGDCGRAMCDALRVCACAAVSARGASTSDAMSWFRNSERGGRGVRRRTWIAVGPAVLLDLDLATRDGPGRIGTGPEASGAGTPRSEAGGQIEDAVTHVRAALTGWPPIPGSGSMAVRRSMLGRGDCGPDLGLGEPDLRSWWRPSQGRVRADGVGVPAPGLDQGLRFSKAVEDLAVQEVVAEASVEALDAARRRGHSPPDRCLILHPTGCRARA